MDNSAQLGSPVYSNFLTYCLGLGEKRYIELNEKKSFISKMML